MIDRYTLIWKFIQKHGYKYDYREVNNVNDFNDKTTIICDKHGKFQQYVKYHIYGSSCNQCGHEKRIEQIRPNKLEYYLNKFHEAHLDDEFEYSRITEIYSSHDKVQICCKKHNVVFEQEVRRHLQLRKTCPMCISEMRSKNTKNKIKLTTEIALENMKKACENKYSFPTFEYINRDYPIIAICQIHGKFTTSYAKIIAHYNCPKCKGGVKYTDEEWAKVYYDLHKGKYTNIHIDGDLIYAICSKHGEFSVKKISKAYGCPFCSKENIIIKNRLNIFDEAEKQEIINKLENDSSFNLNNYLAKHFIEKAKEIHGDSVIYDKVHYVDMNTEVCLICPEHGEFWQKPSYHLNGQCCAKCYGNVRKTTEEFVEEVKKIHGDSIILDDVNYINNKTLVKCVCPIHGEFHRTPKQLLHGFGCQLCNSSKLENMMLNALKMKDIEVIPQKRFDWLMSVNNNPMSLDFYLPKYDIGIECQGEQHFQVVEHFGGEDKFKQTVERDILKKKLCEDHNIKLLYFSNLKIEYPYEVFTNIDELISYIININ